MKHKQKLLSGLLSVWLALTAFPLSAFAGGYYGSDESGNTVPPAAIDSITISTEDVAIETACDSVAERIRRMTEDVLSRVPERI